MNALPALVPELAVRDLEASKHFWCELIGFTVDYERPEERFAYLTLGTAHIMLDQIATGRTWATGDFDPPLGRGINFEIQVPTLGPVLERLHEAAWPLFRDPETVWYRQGATEIGVEQFLVQDPDGYLLRPQSEIGERPVSR